MANSRAATAVQSARAFIKESTNKKFELRPEMTNILSGFMQDREFTIPNLAAIKKAEKQVTTAMYKTRKAFTIGSSKSCSPSGETSGSGSVNLTWAQKNFSIQIQTKKYANNEIGLIQAVADDLMEAEKSLFLGASGIDAALITYLEANKTQVNTLSAGGGHNTWDSVGNQVKVLLADKDRFPNWLVAEMQMNNYEGNMIDFANTLWKSESSYYSHQGGQNDKNLAFQFDGLDTKFSNLIVPSGYNQHVHYVVPTGAVAFLDWNDPLNVKGQKTSVGEYSTAQSLLVPGLTYDVYTKESCADTTDDGGSKQDSVIDMEFTLNYSVTKAPSSVANESGIFKYVNLTT